MGFDGFQEAEKSRLPRKDQKWRDRIGRIQRRVGHADLTRAASCTEIMGESPEKQVEIRSRRALTRWPQGVRVPPAGNVNILRFLK